MAGELGMVQLGNLCHRREQTRGQRVAAQSHELRLHEERSRAAREPRLRSCWYAGVPAGCRTGRGPGEPARGRTARGIEAAGRPAGQDSQAARHVWRRGRKLDAEAEQRGGPKRRPNASERTAKRRGRAPKAVDETPDDKAQMNFTDPEVARS